MTKETEILEGENTELELSGGLKVHVNRLKTRSTFKLFKILTRGASYALAEFDLGSSTEDFTEGLIYAMILAVPEAEDETIDFLRHMVTPSELILDPKSKAEKEVNADILTEFERTLDDPELDDLVTIIEQIIKTEAPHIQQLGKRLSSMWKTFQKDKS